MRDAREGKVSCGRALGSRFLSQRGCAGADTLGRAVCFWEIFYPFLGQVVLC